MTTTSVNTSTASVSGLVSGLDTSSIISQMMALEAQTQTNLKNQKTTEQSDVTTLQDLNSTFAALSTTAQTLANPSAWNPVTVASSNPLIAATAGSTAKTGSLSITVGGIATAQQLRFTSTAALTDTATTGSSTFLLTRADGTTQTLDSSNSSLGGVIAALNATGTGVKAATTRLDDGTYRLQVTSTTTGAGSDFTLTNLDGSSLLGGATVAPGQDASITVNGDTVHSATNAFTNVAGLTINLDPTITAGTVVNLSVAQDATSMTATVSSFVDAINAALNKISTQTAYDATTQTSGPLSTDSGIQSLGNSLLDSVYPTDGTSLASIGIQLDRYGNMTFDADTFTAAYQADPTGTAAKFTTASGGFAARVQAVANAASNPVDGSITTSITSHNATISELTDSISDWDARLALKQQSLQDQFDAMETALSQLNSQSSYLASALGTSSSSSSSTKGS
ncbi:MAG TPA: flagellar filament capping protein FliD [Marmoricola sp.]|jgi:flagellar hook-associated protein 2|nr:flagellar filament capping protein FliD [Marmoricola sp.]